MVVVFGCDRSLKGVVGCGWVRCGLWVVGRCDCGSWIVVMDRRAEVGRGHGRGWVGAEVAPVMTFFEWVCSGGFQIGSGDDFF